MFKSETFLLKPSLYFTHNSPRLDFRPSGPPWTTLTNLPSTIPGLVLTFPPTPKSSINTLVFFSLNKNSTTPPPLPPPGADGIQVTLINPFTTTVTGCLSSPSPFPSGSSPSIIQVKTCPTYSSRVSYSFYSSVIDLFNLFTQSQVLFLISRTKPHSRISVRMFPGNRTGSVRTYPSSHSCLNNSCLWEQSPLCDLLSVPSPVLYPVSSVGRVVTHWVTQ